MGMGESGECKQGDGAQKRGDGMRLEHVSEFKYLGCVQDKVGTDEGKCNKVASGKWNAGTIWLMFEHARVLHETLLVPT